MAQPFFFPGQRKFSFSKRKKNPKRKKVDEKNETMAWLPTTLQAAVVEGLSSLEKEDVACLVSAIQDMVSSATPACSIPQIMSIECVETGLDQRFIITASLADASRVDLHMTASGQLILVRDEMRRPHGRRLFPVALGPHSLSWSNTDGVLFDGSKNVVDVVIEAGFYASLDQPEYPGIEMPHRLVAPDGKFLPEAYLRLPRHDTESCVAMIIFTSMWEQQNTWAVLFDVARRRMYCARKWCHTDLMPRLADVRACTSSDGSGSFRCLVGDDYGPSETRAAGYDGGIDACTIWHSATRPTPTPPSKTDAANECLWITCNADVQFARLAHLMDHWDEQDPCSYQANHPLMLTSVRRTLPLYSDAEGMKRQSSRSVLPLRNDTVYTPIDFDYHGFYSVERQQTCHLPLLTRLLGSEEEKEQGNECPIVILCAGAMGAGKSHVAKQLFIGRRRDRIIVWNDCDEIKSLLPEAEAYAKQDSATAGSRLHRESCFLSERLFWETLYRGQSTLLQGSLSSDVEWHAQFIGRIREAYPRYRIVILHVTAPLEMVIAREARRCLATKRCIPRATLDHAVQYSSTAVEQLRPLVDSVVHIDNARDEPLDAATIARARIEIQ